MTAAQKKAKDNFKKAIAYRKKSGCSLKEAFAHVYGKKVGAVKKKAAPKKKAAKKAAKKKVAKKAAPKKKAAVRNYGSHKDTKSHNVNISVVSGIQTYEQLIRQIKEWEKIISELNKEYKITTPEYKSNIRKDISLAKFWLKNKKIQLKKELSKPKKNI